MNKIFSGLNVISTPYIIPANKKLIAKNEKYTLKNILTLLGKNAIVVITRAVSSLYTTDKKTDNSSANIISEDIPPVKAAIATPHLLVCILQTTLVATRIIYVNKVFNATSTSA